jgi:hypothetical protein
MMIYTMLGIAICNDVHGQEHRASINDREL